MTAPGSPGDRASESLGPQIGRPVVSTVGVSSQIAPGVPVLAVLAGDTSGMSSDQAVQASVFLPGGTVGNSPDESGAGHGHAGHVHHPNAETEAGR